MKICPICRTQFGDELNFCLNDGSTLKDSALFNPEDTLSASNNATLAYQNTQTANQNNQTYGNAPQNNRQASLAVVLFGIFGLLLLLIGTIGGILLYSRFRPTHDIFLEPTPTPKQSATPYRTPKSELKDNIKVEILEKVVGLDKQKYLKCKITNVSTTVVSPFILTLMFYKGDVKITENSAFANLRYLKPQQSIPVWVRLSGANNYTSVKVKDEISSFPIRKTEEELFPTLIVTETVMDQTSSNYKIRGIIENQKYEKISPKIYVILYDENSEIVGIVETTVNLQKGEKAKFEARAGSMNLYGKPTRFEVIPIAE